MLSSFSVIFLGLGAVVFRMLAKKILIQIFLVLEIGIEK